MSMNYALLIYTLLVVMGLIVIVPHIYYRARYRHRSMLWILNENWQQYLVYTICLAWLMVLDILIGDIERFSK